MYFVIGWSDYFGFGFTTLIENHSYYYMFNVFLSLNLFSDSPLDLKIKSHLVSDMFNLIGK